MMEQHPLVHGFSGSLKRGEAVERDLDDHFCERYSIRKATMKEQRSGIDRVFEDHEGQFNVEYKADWRADETGNAFIETVSVDTSGARGWAYTSKADWLVYAFPQRRRYLLVRVIDLRSALPGWITRFPKGKARNERYSTHGVLVPVPEFETVAHYDGTY